MNREINKIFEQWKQFLSCCYENNDKTTEIHRDNLERVMAYTRQLKDRIDKAIEYIENGCDFKSIYFKETDTEFWKIIMEDNLKNDLLEILKGE